MTKERELYLQIKQEKREKDRELWFYKWNVLRGVLGGVAFLLAVYGLLVGTGRW